MESEAAPKGHLRRLGGTRLLRDSGVCSAIWRCFLFAGLLEALQVAERLGELAVQVGFVAEEALEVFGVGKERFIEHDLGALFQLLLGLALGVVLQGGDGGLEAAVGAAGLVGGEAAAAPLGERELAGDLFFDGADGVEVGGEGVAEGFPVGLGFVLQD
ncbi:MAG: hypothetical protein ACO1SX_11875, partial [Actinomycetota bacterium]